MFSTILTIIYILILLSVSINDIRTMKIPNKIMFPAIVLAFLMVGARPYYEWGSPLLGALFGGGFMLIPAVAFGKNGGMGDVKLAIFMGLILGFPNIIWALLLAHMSAALLIIGVPFGWVDLKSKIPFAPFLSFGTLTLMLIGPHL